MPEAQTKKVSENSKYNDGRKFLKFKWHIHDGRKSIKDKKSFSIQSPLFGEGEWKIRLDSSDLYAKLKYSAHVEAVPVLADRWNPLAISKIVDQTSKDISKECLDKYMASEPLPWNRSGSHTIQITFTDEKNGRIIFRECAYGVTFSSESAVEKFSVTEKQISNLCCDLLITVSIQYYHTDYEEVWKNGPGTSSVNKMMGLLLDKPEYSDIAFHIYTRPHLRRAGEGAFKTIYANKMFLKSRAEYFQSMFASHFKEGAADYTIEEEDEYLKSEEPFDDDENEELEFKDASCLDEEYDIIGTIGEQSDSEQYDYCKGSEKGKQIREDLSNEENGPLLSRFKSIHKKRKTDNSALKTAQLEADPMRKTDRRQRVIVKDSHYVTFKALLYYLYTDIIEFVPLTSSFLKESPCRFVPGHKESMIDELCRAHLRRQSFLKSFQPVNTIEGVPCSAKSIYRLADKLGLTELQKMAEDHIKYSLNVNGVAWEVFSPLSMCYPAVREHTIKYLLEHWHEARQTGLMSQALKYAGEENPNLAETLQSIFKELVYGAHG